MDTKVMKQRNIIDDHYKKYLFRSNEQCFFSSFSPNYFPKNIAFLVYVLKLRSVR